MVRAEVGQTTESFLQVSKIVGERRIHKFLLRVPLLPRNGCGEGGVGTQKLRPTEVGRSLSLSPGSTDESSCYFSSFLEEFQVLPEDPCKESTFTELFGPPGAQLS